MKRLTHDELIPQEEYERQRDSYRQTIIALKRRRRITIGDKVTLVFENRETLRFQIQEMIRVERMVDPEKVQEELDMYNALLPAPGELSATLLIELTDPDTMKQWLDLFMGLDHGQTVGLRAAGGIVYGEFEQACSFSFYLGRPAWIYNGRYNGLEFGSHFADAPQIFLDDEQFDALWTSNERTFLFVPPEQRGAALAQLSRTHKFFVAESGSKTIYANQPIGRTQAGARLEPH